jgi:hypothetical protein
MALRRLGRSFFRSAHRSAAIQKTQQPEWQELLPQAMLEAHFEAAGKQPASCEDPRLCNELRRGKWRRRESNPRPVIPG